MKAIRSRGYREEIVKPGDGFAMVKAVRDHTQGQGLNFGYGLFPSFAIDQYSVQIVHLGNPTPIFFKFSINSHRMILLTDMAPFWEVGYKGPMVGSLYALTPWMNTADDTFDKLDEEQVANLSRLVIAYLGQEAGILGPSDSDDDDDNDDNDDNDDAGPTDDNVVYDGSTDDDGKDDSACCG